eukprot:CAMPEP_0113310608 /NCGR_PEP_ID=MMETSP0010_2-20120614/8186_1 /TAXON_ID=216773 ORGANISM="Corethron hystrix, Strain 308" /NCGR_SAMPLE_ID=MMETSP0010_2 /ASSEMBLY_ACC=CAM_ASM_000155 /LENGTH=117 /DNA_ID=CAMNT_0000166099 /DNA_START=221 /DNA_END=574 /DNA_ORIENTATION=+ /assembly_acc=CAM_ASM_000155
MKAAGKSIVDSGAKTMLKTDVVFMEREIKNRKQAFGVEIYELMEALETDNTLSVEEKEGSLRMAFDRARKDVALIYVKIDHKFEEMRILEEVQFTGNYEDSIATEHSGMSRGPRRYH